MVNPDSRETGVGSNEPCAILFFCYFRGEGEGLLFEGDCGPVKKVRAEFQLDVLTTEIIVCAAVLCASQVKIAVSWEDFVWLEECSAGEDSLGGKKCTQ